MLRRLRDFADVYGEGNITKEIAQKALEALEIDERGFDEMDRRLLLAVIDRFEGGPVGLDTLAASIIVGNKSVVETNAFDRTFVFVTPGQRTI